MINNYINHIALVLDASTSMRRLAPEVIRVANAEIKHLARRSQELDQETRITVYTFADVVECVVYDKDVLRLPSIAEFYRPNGMTALVDAVMQSQLDLEKTAQLYGDHAFLTYVLTDGEENYSRIWTGQRMKAALDAQPDNWSVACLVPDQLGAHEAKKFGFAANNVAVWDTSRREGVTEAGATIRTATDTFMTNRALGIRGSKTLFAGGVDRVNTTQVRASTGFTPLDKNTYALYDVRDYGSDMPLEIRPYVEYITSKEYRTGSAFYELTKPEKIQPQKEILLRNRKSGRVYAGRDARALLFLPDYEVRVKPEENPDFQIFVQSTSVNRKLVAGTKLLVLA